MADSRGTAVVAWSAGVSGAGAALAALLASCKTSLEHTLFIILVAVAAVAFAILLFAGLLGLVSSWFTRHPSIEIAMSGQWRMVKDRHLLQARVAAKNIGSSVAYLEQRGTGLRASIPEDQISAQSPISWRSVRVFEIFREHDWIEPDETISEDLLLDLGISVPIVTLLEARLIWKRSRNWRGINIQVRGREFIYPDSNAAHPPSS